MAVQRTLSWYFPWIPLGLATAVGGMLIALLLVGNQTPLARGADAAPQATAGFQTTDQLLLTINLSKALPPVEQPANLSVELVDGEGTVLHQAVRTLKVEELRKPSPQRFEFPALKVAPEKVTVRCRLDNNSVEVPLHKILLLKAHETTLSSGQEFYQGSSASLRCQVQGVKSLTQTVPLAGAAVSVRLVERNGKAHIVYEDQTGVDGIANVQLRVPAELAAGAYKLEVHTKSALGEETLQREVQVKTAPRVMLVSDKPMYQPGQVMHLRALALNAMDLGPVANAPITFEVEDAKGNKVFKYAKVRDGKGEDKPLVTSEHGIASADFQLATEVNTGDYRVRAILGEHTADKTVTVMPYVLPKFKIDVKSDKRYYLPKETVQVDLQADYFFGKPLANAKLKVTASTFDVAFKDFHTWQGQTDAQGHAKLEIKLPDYFVGQPLQKGGALVRLEVKATDTASHSETVNKTYPVSDKAIKLSLIPEGGRLTPGLENRIFVAALYPDGSPAVCNVQLWQGQKAEGKPLAELKTSASGLAEFRITPKNEQFRQGEWVERKVEMLGGNTIQGWGPKNLFDVNATAKDARGASARETATLTSEPFGENVLLRLDKAVYRGGEAFKVQIQTSAGLPTVFLDVLRNGQVLLSKWLDVKDGKAEQTIDLPANVFGTLDVHAYQMLADGEIIRDSRVVYVHSAKDLKIDVQADQDVYRPGQEGKIRFQVTDAKGKPTAAALGVLIVDEAVYALQDMQPGLEKVYFTLQEELLKPQVQVLYRPAEPIDQLIRQPVLPADKQQVAELLLTAVRPKVPARWEINPVHERRAKVENTLVQFGQALYTYGVSQPDMVREKKAGAWVFKTTALKDLVGLHGWDAAMLTDPMGKPWTFESLVRLEKGFTAERLARAVTVNHLLQVYWQLVNLANSHRATYLKGDKWVFPDDAIDQVVKQVGGHQGFTKDAWGKPFKLERKDKQQPNPQGQPQLAFYRLVSAGPDGKFSTADDITLPVNAQQWGFVQLWWLEDETRVHHLGQQMAQNRRGMMLAGGMGGRRGLLLGMDGMAGMGGGMGGGILGGGAVPMMPPMAKAAQMAPATLLNSAATGAPLEPGNNKGTGGGKTAAAPARMREYFPETLLWRPALIADDKGVASLSVPFADSITTWRLTASASSKAGALGGVSVPLRVFQDFFVDLDLPLNLTVDDEVAFPVAVYNYLKVPQQVTLELKADSWFALVDGQGLKRTLDLKAGEVTSVAYRIRAKKIGSFPLTVDARGSKVSDAIRRSIEVGPNGRKIEQVVSDRLSGKITQTLTVPAQAQPDATKLFVKVYPGVFSQVVEGIDGLLRMPGGCFEQTSSSAYPNILVVDYLKRTRTGSPQVMMRAEAFLNAGYQRLLTFERPGGGFDWWGSGPPLVWLSAYGLNEFNDMAKVWPVDRGVIQRTQAWLMKQQSADGTWSKIGATHSESIERMGSPKLLLTSYVCWALLESGLKAPEELKKAIEYIRDNVQKENNAYILALAANALACWDAKDDSTHAALVKVLQKLEGQKKNMPDWKAISFPAGGQSLSYGRGDYLTVETTALAVLAMMKNGQFPTQVNQALLYLIKTRDAQGTWGSTSATILALKALISSAGGVPHKGTAEFTILVDGQEAGQGKINEDNAEVLQQFDLTGRIKGAGPVQVTLDVKGESSLMYQIVCRHYEAWQKETPKQPVFEVAVDYDRTKLSTADLLRAKATLKYHGKEPTAMVMVDVGIPPGFTVDAGDFAEMVGAKKIQKFEVTSRQVSLYLGDVAPGSVQTFEYSLKPKYPIKAKTPATVAYEYYTPSNRATAAPVELIVEKK